MAQYLPAPPMTSPGATPHQPDDGDLQTRLPSICVDYLSHTWEEEDVWASWRSITRRKNEVANGVRLENASWRTWWKQRNKLKTISPETLNWLKDSDVTWLYGPLHTAVEAVPPPKVATAEERLGLLQAGGKKPILKHRTLSEILTTPMPSSPVLESLDFGDEDSDDFDGDDAQQRYSLLQTKSDTNIFRRNSVSRKNSPSRGPAYPPALGSPDSEAQGGKKHISFNTFVEQCISLDEPTSISPDRDFDDDEDEEDDDDDVLEMRSTSSVTSSVTSIRPTISRQSSTSSEKEHFTIAHIAPARLKTTGDELETSTIFVPPGGNGNATSGSSRYNAQEQSSRTSSEAASSPAPAGGFDFPSPIEAASWDDDDDEYDYFGGPGRGGGAAGNSAGGGGGRSAAGGNPLGSRGASIAPSGVGSVGHYETSSNSPSSSSTSVNQTAPASSVSAPRKGASIAPPQSSPSGNNTTTPPSGNSSSGNTTPSPSPTTSDFPLRTNVAPSRSILKNRSNPATPSTSPETQTSYFVPPANTSAAHTSSNTSINAAPSGAAPQAFLPPVTGSTGHTPIAQLPVSAHAQSEENTTRGRSAVRSSSGTSLSDRVPSRSNSGGASISPSVSSSPIVSSSQPVASIVTSPPAGRGARPPSIKTVNVSTGQPLQPAAPGSDDGGGTGGLGSPKPGEGFWGEGDEKKDGEGKDEAYKYAESTNPTPNSSPLISMRTLSIDSSAASLPHAQSKPSPPISSTAAAPSAVSHTHPGASTVTPGAATSVASPSSATSSLQRTTSNNSASASPFANNSTTSDDGASKEQKGAGGVVATARDLLGALWGMAGEGAKKA